MQVFGYKDDINRFTKAKQIKTKYSTLRGL